MYVKQMLYEHKHVDEHIESLEQIVEGYEEMKYQVSLAQKMDGMPIAQGKTSDSVCCHVLSIEKYDEKINTLKAYIKELRDRKKQIDDCIEEISDKHSVLIKLRYFDKESWTKISRGLKISKRQCYRINNEALRAVGEKVKG